MLYYQKKNINITLKLWLSQSIPYRLLWTFVITYTKTFLFQKPGRNNKNKIKILFTEHSGNPIRCTDTGIENESVSECS